MPRRPLRQLLSLSVFGFAGSQLAYLGAIQFSNAATATLLQFLFLPIVAGYEAVKGVLRWSVQWTVSLLLAMVGTLFLVGGVPGWNFRILVTSNGVLFGLLAAVSGAYYTLASRPLVRAHGSWWVTTWGFAIGGLVTVPFGVESFSELSNAIDSLRVRWIGRACYFRYCLRDDSGLRSLFGWLAPALGHRDWFSFLLGADCGGCGGVRFPWCDLDWYTVSRWGVDHSGSGPLGFSKG